MTLYEVIREVLEISDFAAAILKNGRNVLWVAVFFSGNIANMIPEGLPSKMVSLMEDHGGGGAGGGGLCTGTPVSSSTNTDRKF